MATETVENVVMMETAKLIPCKLNPRRDFDGIQSLVASIKKDKIIEPLIVRLLPEGPEVIRGERRRRAAILAGLPKVPVIIRDYGDQQVIELALVEKLEDKDLSDYEKGLACIELKKKYNQKYPDNTAIAERFGVSRQTVERWIKAASEIPKEIQKFVTEGDEPGITTDTALAIVKQIEGSERQLAITKAIAEKGTTQTTAKKIISEAKRCPGESITKIVKRVVEAAVDLIVTPEHAETLKAGAQGQVSLLKLPPGIEDGAKVNLHSKSAEVGVLSIVSKALRDFTEEDAKAEGYSSLEEYKTHWKQAHIVWNPKKRLYMVKFKVNKVEKLVASTPTSTVSASTPHTSSIATPPTTGAPIPSTPSTPAAEVQTPTVAPTIPPSTPAEAAKEASKEEAKAPEAIGGT